MAALRTTLVLQDSADFDFGTPDNRFHIRAGRVYLLASGGTPPAGWESPGFDDSAWAVPIKPVWSPGHVTAQNGDWLTYPGAIGASDTLLFRWTWPLPAPPYKPGGVHSLQWGSYEAAKLWVNGTRVDRATNYVQVVDLGIPPDADGFDFNGHSPGVIQGGELDTALLLRGQTNLVAAHVKREAVNLAIIVEQRTGQRSRAYTIT